VVEYWEKRLARHRGAFIRVAEQDSDLTGDVGVLQFNTVGEGISWPRTVRTKTKRPKNGASGVSNPPGAA
jgi:hypothetical protein